LITQSPSNPIANPI
jgi:serine/threonine-protein kinase SRPK3